MTDGRFHDTAGSLDLYEPATEEEMSYLLSHMRHEELKEGTDAGSTPEDRERAIKSCRRLLAVYHNGVLLCVGEMMDGDGFRNISCERTVHCLEPGHRFAWLRDFPALVDWFRNTDDQMGGVGRFYTITPTEYPRALDLYGKAGGRVIKTIDVAGVPYWLLDMTPGEE